MILIKPLNQLTAWLSKVIPLWLLGLSARAGIFTVFWFSVQTKITGGTIWGQHFKFWNVTDTTLMLFEHEYALPLLPYKVAAYAGTITEFVLSITLLLGLFTRLSALGLLCVTVVIQIFVYPNAWAAHLTWFGLLIFLLKDGAGLISLDRVLRIR